MYCHCDQVFYFWCSLLSVYVRCVDYENIDRRNKRWSHLTIPYEKYIRYKEIEGEIGNFKFYENVNQCDIKSCYANDTQTNFQFQFPSFASGSMNSSILFFFGDIHLVHRLQ